MKPYLAILGARFRTLLQYRAAAAAGIGTRIFWGLIRVMIFEAFYRSSPEAQPMTLPQTVTYVWLGQAMLASILWGIDRDVSQMVRTGTVAYELLRPVDLYGLWFSRALAARVAPTVAQAGPVLLFAAVFFHFGPPPSPAAALAWLGATALGFLLSAALSTLVTVSLLWTVSGEGIARLMPALVYTLSGMIVPLPLLPPAMRGVIAALPFAGLIDVPFRIYLGHIGPAEALGPMAGQAAWVLALALWGRWLLGRGLGRLAVQGG